MVTRNRKNLMARSDLLIRLVKAALSSDRLQVEKVTNIIAAEERAKQHNILADRLATALRTTPAHNRFLPHNTPPQINGNGGRKDHRDFLADITPRRCLDDIILPSEITELCKEIIEEQHRADLLRSHGLEPRHRILLAGPPGNGKTSLAEALAYELSTPFFVVRYETVIGSYLGETSGRLKRIFDYARTLPCVLFFDEFDTLGKERGDTHETGEIKRVVSSLLLQIDELPSYTIVITATNHPELLDRAVWRRFQVRVNLPVPSHKKLISYLVRFFSRFTNEGIVDYSTLATQLHGASFAEVEEFCLDIQRRFVLALGDASLNEIITARIRHWKSRFNPAPQSLA
jgi:SpoVK/Ycf46/Vps4 family AAA+-type ATPase